MHANPAIPFFTVAPTVIEAPAYPELADVSVGLVPLILPEYLDRPQIVTRSSPTKLELAELERWVESPDSMLTRTLTQNLSNLTGSDMILVLPQRRETSFDHYLEVELLRFDTGPDGMVLDGRWSLYDGRSEQVQATNRSVINVPVSDQNLDRFDAIVQAMSDAFAQLSNEVAAAIAASDQ